jgi:hypothetical protein
MDLVYTAGFASRDYNYFTILLSFVLDEVWTTHHFWHSEPNNLHLAEVEDAISTDRSPCEIGQSYRG